VLAGWPPFKWGTLGLGPRPPSLAPIYALGVDATLLQTMIVAVFTLDSASPPEFRPAGSCSLLEASFASTTMWFEHRVERSQMEKLIICLRRYHMQTFETVPGEAELLRWSKAVHVQFDADNLHLTGRWISETERAEREAPQSELATLKVAMTNLTGVVQTLARAITHGSGDATGADTSAAPAFAAIGADTSGAPVSALLRTTTVAASAPPPRSEI